MQPETVSVLRRRSRSLVSRRNTPKPTYFKILLRSWRRRNVIWCLPLNSNSHPEGIELLVVMKIHSKRCRNEPKDTIISIHTELLRTTRRCCRIKKAIGAVFWRTCKKTSISTQQNQWQVTLLGAAGAIEAIGFNFGYGAIKTAQTTITNSRSKHDPALNLPLNKPQKVEVNVAMSNTFLFCGHNACVLFKKISWTNFCIWIFSVVGHFQTRSSRRLDFWYYSENNLVFDPVNIDFCKESVYASLFLINPDVTGTSY